MSADEFFPFGTVAPPPITGSIEFGDSFGVMAFHMAFVKQAEVLWKVEYKTLPERIRQCIPLFLCIREDVRALTLLVAQGFSNQSYVIYRALLEKIVTVLYLQVAPEEIFGDYMRYPLHKSYQKTQKDVRVKTKTGEVGYRSVTTVDLSEYPQMQEAVNRFTSRSGKPQTRWTNSSIASKVSHIKQSGIFDTAVLELLISYMYDDASEALHATLYGCLFHLDVFEARNLYLPEPDPDEHLQERLFLSSWLGAVVMFQVVEWVLGQTDQKELLEEAKVMDGMIRERMKRALDKPKQPAPVDDSLGQPK